MWLLEDILISNRQRLKGKYSIILIWINIGSQKSEAEWYRMVVFKKKNPKLKKGRRILFQNKSTLQLKLCLRFLYHMAIIEEWAVKRSLACPPAALSLSVHGAHPGLVIQVRNPEPPLITLAPRCPPISFKTPTFPSRLSVDPGLPSSFSFIHSQNPSKSYPPPGTRLYVEEHQGMRQAHSCPDGGDNWSRDSKGGGGGMQGAREGEGVVHAGRPPWQEVRVCPLTESRAKPNSLVTTINVPGISFLTFQSRSNLLIYLQVQLLLHGLSSWLGNIPWLRNSSLPQTELNLPSNHSSNTAPRVTL